MPDEIHDFPNECLCTPGVRHVFHCKRCDKPITARNEGIMTKDGETHRACSSTQEFVHYMAVPEEVRGRQQWIDYMKGMR